MIDVKISGTELLEWLEMRKENWSAEASFKGEVGRRFQAMRSAIDLVIDQVEAMMEALNLVECQPKVGEWIPVSEGMPEEHEVSEPIFDPVTLAEIDVKYNTTSDLAQVTVKDEDGERFVYFDYTVDGKWFCYNEDLGFEVLAWQPLPEPAKETTWAE